MPVSVKPLPDSGLKIAQAMVRANHYLHRKVDPRCSPLAYAVRLEGLNIGGLTAGCLIFGRPEATRCGNWYGSVEDVQAGRCEVTRWQVLNLARVYLDRNFQRGGKLYSSRWIPGFQDRNGEWRSTMASEAIAGALDRVVLDYLLARPPCFPDEPYELAWCLSYCDTNRHKGTLYRAAGFELYRTNDRGIQTWRKRFRPLSESERARILDASAQSARSRRYRAQRAAMQLPIVWERAQA